jgi:hypothetical protein
VRSAVRTSASTNRELGGGGWGGGMGEGIRTPATLEVEVAEPTEEAVDD